ncbi:hypothetical protein [Streptomyces sp. NBC_01445]|uniref:hypothetical protein n=1 Tax=Streptomyces sp. NBC_01445 TaxID=2903869 RepID=UPI002DDC0AE3|nr:hypothetical protein [Streptomyces sp. NBC_01445]WSE11671.1 hypothetical protein OG574_51865 [Streptomyces sp. NBC_01445]
MFSRKPSALVAQAMCVGAIATVVATATPASAQANVPCSASALSTAIANASAGDSLVLARGCTYSLLTPLPAIQTTITIVGRNSTITRDPGAGSFGILSVAPSGNLTLTNTTITNGDAPDFGGGIANRGRLTVNGSDIRDNRANFSGGIGGGSGTVTRIVNTSIVHNTANVNGGGVANDGDMTIVNSRITDNTATNGVGGGLANDGVLRITSTDVNVNHAPGNRAGGVANVGGGTTSITSSNVNNNTAALAPGGILNSGGSVTLTASRVRGNLPTNCAGSNIPVPNCVG